MESIKEFPFCLFSFILLNTFSLEQVDFNGDFLQILITVRSRSFSKAIMQNRNLASVVALRQLRRQTPLAPSGLKHRWVLCVGIHRRLFFTFFLLFGMVYLVFLFGSISFLDLRGSYGGKME